MSKDKKDQDPESRTNTCIAITDDRILEMADAYWAQGQKAALEKNDEDMLVFSGVATLTWLGWRFVKAVEKIARKM